MVAYCGVSSRPCLSLRVYIVFALLVCFPMLMVWFNNPHDLSTFTPAWAFLVRSHRFMSTAGFNIAFCISHALGLPDGA